MENQQQAVPMEYYFERYKQLDPSEAAERTGLLFDAQRGRFVVNVLGHTIYAAWPEFELTAEEQGSPETLTGFCMQIVLARFILKGRQVLSGGEFRSYRELPWGTVYDSNFQGRCIKRFAYAYGARPAAFAEGAEGLGGTRVKYGDAAYDMPFLGNVTVRMILWEGDDEFPPSSQILFSDNTPHSFDAEDLAATGDIIIGCLKEITR